MKTIILLTVLVASAFLGCKKGDKVKKAEKPLSVDIQRVWETTLDKKEYYDESNNKVFEQVLAPGVHYTMKEGTLKVKDLKGKTITGTYILSTSNGKTIITITLNGTSEAYELVSITNKTMTIRQEKSNQTYNNNGEKIAPKQIYTLEFVCPCG